MTGVRMHVSISVPPWNETGIENGVQCASVVRSDQESATNAGALVIRLLLALRWCQGAKEACSGPLGVGTGAAEANKKCK